MLATTTISLKDGSTKDSEIGIKAKGKIGASAGGKGVSVSGSVASDIDTGSIEGKVSGSINIPGVARGTAAAKVTVTITPPDPGEILRNLENALKGQKEELDKE